MKRQSTYRAVSRGLSVVAVGVLTLVLLAFLPSPGYRTSRLVLFGLVGLAGWVGAAGAVVARARPLVVGAVGLFLLGFWQFTIGWVALPTAAVLLVTAILVSDPPNDPATTPG